MFLTPKGLSDSMLCVHEHPQKRGVSYVFIELPHIGGRWSSVQIPALCPASGTPDELLNLWDSQVPPVFVGDKDTYLMGWSMD